jgi:hypothetical protein
MTAARSQAPRELDLCFAPLVPASTFRDRFCSSLPPDPIDLRIQALRIGVARLAQQHFGPSLGIAFQTTYRMAESASGRWRISGMGFDRRDRLDR